MKIKNIDLLVVFKVVVSILFFMAVSLLIPATYSIFVGDGQFMDFIYPFLIVSSLYLIAYQIEIEDDLTLKEAILSICLIWLIFPAISAFAYWINGAIPNFIEAYFESVSGFTTTGASILTNVEGLPKSLLLWRSTTNWVGGLGFVVFAIALLPALGTGGMQMMKFEASKAVEEKLKPKVKEVARIIFIIYNGLIFTEILLLVIGGMPLFDAVNHAFCTIATGGFSVKNSSIGSYHSVFIEMVIALFMIFGSVNFLNWYQLYKSKNWKVFFKSEENKLYFIILGVTIFLCAFMLTVDGVYNPLQALRYSIFQVINSASTTGFSSTNYTYWPSFVLAILIILEFLGGVSGSTAGGLKQFRLVALGKSIYGEMKKTAHPKLIYRIKMEGKTLDFSALNAIWAFGAAYTFIIVIIGIVLCLTGTDLITAFSSSIACASCSGPGLLKTGPAGNFHFFADWQKFLLSIEMLLGRLEIFALFAIFMPSFWKD